EDGCTLEEQAAPAIDEGVDSVWLEVNDPVEDTTTFWDELPPAARGGADLLADGGAVRVDLSLGSKEAPDIEQLKAGKGSSKPEALRSWVGDSTKDLRGRTTDLVALARLSVAGPSEDEEQDTDEGALLEDRITEDQWIDDSGSAGEDGQ
ncbi:MAG: hypothetical protein VX498_15910, partial [Myxococcota bacterium]|nr:hypothetical protein [Myxococcota bacterium]